MSIKLTVISYVYNHEKYLRDALEGFVSQKTNFKYKIVIHDDASTDSSQEIIREYAEKYPDLICPILQKENTRKLMPAKERFKTYILPWVEGDYVAMCEGDDYWCDENKLQRQVDFLDSHPEYSACVHNSWFLNMKTGEKKEYNHTHKEDCDLTREELFSGVAWKYQTSSLVYRSHFAAERPSFFDKINVGDYPKAIQLSAEGKVRFIADIMSTYRFMSNPTSWSSNNASSLQIQKRKQLISMELDMLEEVKKCYPHCADIAEKAINYKKYHALFLDGNVREIKKNKEYREIYSKESFVRKVKLRIRKILSFFN